MSAERTFFVVKRRCFEAYLGDSMQGPIDLHLSMSNFARTSQKKFGWSRFFGQGDTPPAPPFASGTFGHICCPWPEQATTPMTFFVSGLLVPPIRPGGLN
jgi:hypothetical protein